MPDAKPFNSLGQILAGGGEIALGLAIARGWGQGKIDSMIKRRFEPMTPEDKSSLWRLASEGVEAAEGINSRQANRDDSRDAFWKDQWQSIHEAMLDDSNWLDNIPINSSLGGDTSEGRRFRYVGVLIGDDGKDFLTVRGWMADALSEYDIVDEIANKARQDISRSPKGLSKITPEMVEEATIQIVFIERRF